MDILNLFNAHVSICVLIFSVKYIYLSELSVHVRLKQISLTVRLAIKGRIKNSFIYICGLW